LLEQVLIGILLICIGFISLAAGYRLVRLLLPVIGFVIGFAIGVGIVEAITGEGLGASLLAGLVGAGVGILLAILAYAFYTFAVLVLAVAVGAGLTAATMIALGFQAGSPAVAIAAMLGGLALALLTLFFKLEQIFLVILTAVFGAAVMMTGAALALGRIPLSVVGSGEALPPLLQSSLLAFLIFLIVVIVGVVVQTQISAPETDIE
jgi:hypothetical protein